MIDGLIEAGEGVADAADLSMSFMCSSRRHVFRAAEHHVLEHVGEALAIGPFVAGADVVNHPHLDHRRLMQRGVDDPQAVGQRFLGEIDFLDRGGCGWGGVGGEKRKGNRESSPCETGGNPFTMHAVAPKKY